MLCSKTLQLQVHLHFANHFHIKQRFLIDTWFLDTSCQVYNNIAQPFFFFFFKFCDM